jgi:hypothetical protein
MAINSVGSQFYDVKNSERVSEVIGDIHERENIAHAQLTLHSAMAAR